MITEFDVYVAFRKAQASAKNRGYKIPKDFKSHLANKFTKKNREALVQATKYFNTKWQNIDVDRFMECGFELLKSFSYINFHDKRVMNLYIQKDKARKHDNKKIKSKMVESAKFVKKLLNGNKSSIPKLKKYSLMKDGKKSLPVSHYLQGNIDKFFLTWLMMKRCLILSDMDRPLIPLIERNYRTYCDKLREIKPFLKRLEEKI